MAEKIESDIKFIEKFGDYREYWNEIKILFDESSNVNSSRPDAHLYLQNLLDMPVTKLSRFGQDKWDYNRDAINPPKNVQGAKLCIDFSNYTAIPNFIIIEIKCMFYSVNLVPLSFAKKGSTAVAKRANTTISQFEAGLRFIDYVFQLLKIEFGEFIENHFSALSDLTQHDFENAAKSFTFQASNALYKFFYYLKHPITGSILGTDVKADFDKLAFPYTQNDKTSRKASLVFENADFEQLVLFASERIVEFLDSIGEDVSDKIALKYVLQKQQSNKLSMTASLLVDYTIIRLSSKGYSQEYISENINIPNYLLDVEGLILNTRTLRDKVKLKHGLKSLDIVRSYINCISYSANFLVAMFTGMRPNALSEICISNSTITENDVDLVVSTDKKNKNIVYKNLFDDKWVAIPIVMDALAVAKKIAVIKANDYLFSNMDTVDPNADMQSMASTGITTQLSALIDTVLGVGRAKEIKPNVYLYRHTLAYQLFRAELGLPFISFQLKHIVGTVRRYSNNGAASETTLGYGYIGEKLIQGPDKMQEIRHLAEKERVKAVMDPDGTYMGPKGKEHKERLTKVFAGFAASGYSKDEVFDVMAEQGIAVINVGTGFCYGGVESFDESLPCIGTLRCNPIRCSNAVVTNANAPKWKEVYYSNIELRDKPGYEHRREQIEATIAEAKMVLEGLGIKVG